MTTTVYGESDDLIEFRGDVYGEASVWDADSDNCKRGALLVFSDGTVLEAIYGNAFGAGIWKFSAIAQGSLFRSIERKAEEDDEGHSDIVTFRDGLTWAIKANPGEWERVS